MHLPYLFEGLRLPKGLLKAAIVLTLIGYCLAIGYLVGKNRHSLLLLLLAPPVAFLALTIAFRYFQFLVLLLPLTALTLPHVQLSTGTYTQLPVSLLLTIGLTALWLVSMSIRGNRPVATPLNKPLLCFGILCILSFVWGVAWRDPLADAIPNFIVVQIGALVTILVSLSVPILIGNFVTTPGQLKYIVGCFLVFGSAMTLTQLFKVDQIVLNDRGLWGTWVIACAYGLLIAQPDLRRRWRWLLAAIVLLTFYQTMLINSDWISGWFPSVIAIAAITFLRSWKLGLVLMVVGTVAIVGSLGFFEAVAQSNIDDGSLERLEIWEQNWGVTSEHWLLGTGPAGYAIYYMSYFPTTARSTHNNYLDILSQFGIVGLVVWMWVMVTSVYVGWRTVRMLPPGLLKTMAMIAAGGWVAALVSMIFGDWVLPFAYNQGISGYKYTVYSWIFLGVLVAINRINASTIEHEVAR